MPQVVLRIGNYLMTYPQPYSAFWYFLCLDLLGTTSAPVTTTQDSTAWNHMPLLLKAPTMQTECLYYWNGLFSTPERISKAEQKEQQQLLQVCAKTSNFYFQIINRYIVHTQPIQILLEKYWWISPMLYTFTT